MCICVSVSPPPSRARWYRGVPHKRSPHRFLCRFLCSSPLSGSWAYSPSGSAIHNARTQVNLMAHTVHQQQQVPSCALRKRGAQVYTGARERIEKTHFQGKKHLFLLFNLYLLLSFWSFKSLHSLWAIGKIRLELALSGGSCICAGVSGTHSSGYIQLLCAVYAPIYILCI